MNQTINFAWPNIYEVVFSHTLFIEVYILYIAIYLNYCACGGPFFRVKAHYVATCSTRTKPSTRSVGCVGCKVSTRLDPTQTAKL